MELKIRLSRAGKYLGLKLKVRHPKGSTTTFLDTIVCCTTIGLPFYHCDSVQLQMKPTCLNLP